MCPSKGSIRKKRSLSVCGVSSLQSSAITLTLTHTQTNNKSDGARCDLVGTRPALLRDCSRGAGERGRADPEPRGPLPTETMRMPPTRRCSRRRPSCQLKPSCTAQRRLHLRKDVHAGIELYRRSIAANASRWDAHYFLGRALKTTGELNGAADAFEASLRWLPPTWLSCKSWVWCRVRARLGA